MTLSPAWFSGQDRTSWPSPGVTVQVRDLASWDISHAAAPPARPPGLRASQNVHRAGYATSSDLSRAHGQSALGYWELRYVMTARTRLWSSGDGGRQSELKMLLTCFSTV